MAINADTKPCNTALRKNGIRMKFHDAPTNFIVCMVKRREYILKRIVLLIKENDTTVSRAAMINNTILIFPNF